MPGENLDDRQLDESADPPVNEDNNAGLVDRSAAVPLYHQIYLQLRDEIVSGVRPYGSSVPTEQELSDSFGVSRITARRTLDELAAQHFVVRKRRVGTKVSYRTPTKPFEANLSKAVDSLLTFGRATKVSIREMGKAAAKAPIAGLLGVEIGAPLLRAVRIRWLDNEPLGYIVSYVPAKVGQSITRKKLESQPILAILQEAGWTVNAAKQMIAATIAEPHIAQALGLDVISPVLRITRTFRNAHNAPVLLTQAHYRADRYQITLDLQAEEIQFGATPDGEM